MCRIAAYVGPPASLASLLYAPEHSLEHQSYRPREMLSGTVNVDGTGVAWWQKDAAEPLRYVTTLPPWSDPNLPTLAPRLRGSPILATVRSATPGIPVETGAVLPYAEGGIAGTHNGYLNGFADGVAAALLAELPAEWQGRIGTMTDARLLFLLAVAEHDRRPRAGLADACERATARAAQICAELGHTASLNLVLADRSGVAGVRFAEGAASNSLYTHRMDSGALRLASEPLDDAQWEPVPDRHLVVLNADGIDIRPAGRLTEAE